MCERVLGSGNIPEGSYVQPNGVTEHVDGKEQTL